MAEFGAASYHKTVPLNGPNDNSAPMEGAVICSTSVPDEKRTQLVEYATQMGAVERLHLTHDVTHLIVGQYDTPKYRYVARERPEVRAMTIEWIEEIRELWMNDQDIDMDALEQKHTLPTLHSLKLSMTGCDDLTERLEIADLIKVNGGIYEGDLTKQITHLISFKTEGAKYKAAKSWGLKIVSIEWLRDSLERGMILDETLYDPLLPIEDRGKGAWNKTKPKERLSLGKRSRTEAAESGRRKLRRTASSKLMSQSENLWGDIVGGGMAIQVADSGVWEATDKNTLPANGKPDSKSTIDQASSGTTQSTAENPFLPKGIFSGCRYYLHNFPLAKRQILQGHLLTADGEVVDTVEELFQNTKASTRLFRIVSHDLPISELPELPESEIPVQTVTVWWVERCLHHKKFFNPSEHVIGRPFPAFPIEGFSRLSISTSAFTGIDLLHVKKAIELIGGTYSEEMTPSSSLVVTRSLQAIRKDKFVCAQQWDIPIVSAEWLWDSIKAGTKLSTLKYRCRSQKRKESVPAPSKTLEAATTTKTGRSKSEITASSELKPKISEPGRSKSEITKSSSTKNEGTDHVLNHRKPVKPFEIDMDDFKPPEKTPSMATTQGTASEPSGGGPPASKPWLDNSAFEKELNDVKEERDTQPLNEPTPTSETTQDASPKLPKPLSERSLNSNSSSPSRTVSTAPAPSDHPNSKPSNTIDNTITDLLAKTKSSAQQPPSDPEPRKRGGNRILGRVTSNLSTNSTAFSRATSVDSTATHGNPVEYPAPPGSSTSNQPTLSEKDKTANEKIEMLMNGDKFIGKDMDSQPPPTQLQYEDPDSTEAREMVMARMKGEKAQRKGLKEKAVTIGDFVDKKKVTRRSRVAGFR